MSEKDFNLYAKLVATQHDLVRAQEQLNHALTFLVVYLMESEGEDEFSEERLNNAMKVFEDNGTLPTINFTHPDGQEGIVVLTVKEVETEQYQSEAPSEEDMNKLYDLQGRLIGRKNKLDA